MGGGEEESAGHVEWVEKSLDYFVKEDSSETSTSVWIEDT